MHSANRAKQRQRQALESMKQQSINHNNNKIQIAFGSRAPTTPVTRRSKSLDRKSNSRKVQLMREQSADERASDSGLSGLDDGSKKAASPEEAISMVDSGRRSQSFEFLSDDLRSMTLSTPSSPSPRPPAGKIRGHVHFLSKEREGHNTSAIVRNMVVTSALQPDQPGSLKKSTSIPVHLTVSTNNEVVLPPSLRPHSTCHLEHEPDCAALKANISEKWSSAQSLPTHCGTKSRRGTPSTPTGETLSSLQKKKFIKVTNGYNSLPRNSSLRESLYSPVPRSRSSASIGGADTPKQPSRPPSVASTSISTKSRPNSKSGSSRSHHASLSIAQIQRELKRGEMVQGVLHLGSLRTPSFGSRMIKEREEEETCICAPVVIGGKNGHMEWRRM